MPHIRILVAVTVAAVAAVGGTTAWSGATSATAPVDAPAVTVYKSPTCTCCAAWIEHMREHGFTVEAKDTDGMAQVKATMGVPTSAQSCHTAVVGGYVVEGHVPAGDVARLLEERPQVGGIAAAGMPIGSPGMEVAGRSPEPYAVVSFTREGVTGEFARH